MMSHKNATQTVKKEIISEYRLVVVGSPAVGKSSLIKRFVKNQFSPFEDRTIGCTVINHMVCIENDKINLCSKYAE